MTPAKRYDSIWSDSARVPGSGGIGTAETLRIETFEGSRRRLWQIDGRARQLRSEAVGYL
jgi:hypothetical protein